MGRRGYSLLGGSYRTGLGQPAPSSKEMQLPVGVSTVVFIIFSLITSAYELYLGSTGGFSGTKIVATMVFSVFIELMNRTGPKYFSWAILIMFFTAYFTITIVATSCARGNSDTVTPALETIRDHGLLSPFVLNETILNQLHLSRGKNESGTTDEATGSSSTSVNALLAQMGISS